MTTLKMVKAKLAHGHLWPGHQIVCYGPVSQVLEYSVIDFGKLKGFMAAVAMVMHHLRNETISLSL